MKTHLVIIDPQNDFCDPNGALHVPNADKDMERLALMIHNHREKIHQIQITLDSHHWVHIAHPFFWEGQNAEMPDLFTLIQVEDVEGDNPKWRARHPKYRQRAIDYVHALKSNGRYTLCIWPPHCLIGTWGNNIYPPLVEALRHYQELFSPIKYTTKGSNIFTEHYSAVKADVIDPTDPTTSLNLDFIKDIKEADRVLFAGEALSHCVANTLHDVLEDLGDEYAKKFVILEDASGNIPGFEKFGHDFLKEMKDRGIRIATTEICFD